MYVQVIPMSNVTPSSSSDTTAVSALFQSFESAYNITNAGGNEMGVVSLISSVSSYIVDSTGVRMKCSFLYLNLIFSYQCKLILLYFQKQTNKPKNPYQ
jgi:Mn2+/Fe2+ NRAMP family transporter